MTEVLFQDCAQSVQVVEDRENCRYVLYVDGAQAGTMPYCNAEGRRVLGHAEIGGDYCDRGLSGLLVQAVLDDLEERQQKVAVCCPAVDRYARRRIKYADVIDPSHPGVWFGPPADGR
ncbi:GNAT family N-acetyltransferase [Streptomyces sp. NPDC101209]|uniref:GNAT family N-acetyltransferase n=1 Tax=Streptomyces sp. NPDC101209 TaxID=3366129 RepID=UPI0038212CB6